MKGKVFGALILVALLCLGGCSTKTSAPADYGPAEEEKLVIYTSHKEEVYRPLVREFQERTGIWVQVVEGGTNELLSRIQQEQEDPQADVMFGGGTDSLASYRDCFTPYQPREANRIQSSLRSPDGIWTPFSALPVVLVYNSKLVEEKQITGWSDLLRPAFQGRIAFADPEISGSSFTALMTYLLVRGDGTEAGLREVAVALSGRLLTSSGEVLSSVAEGNCLVGITLEETALKYITSGSNISMVYPAEGTSCVPDGSALIAGAPHEKNAQLFLDFTVCQDVQERLQADFFRRSVRSDIPSQGKLLPLDAISILPYDMEWVNRNRQTILSDWSFYCKEGD